MCNPLSFIRENCFFSQHFIHRTQYFEESTYKLNRSFIHIYIIYIIHMKKSYFIFITLNYNARMHLRREVIDWMFSRYEIEIHLILRRIKQKLKITYNNFNTPTFVTRENHNIPKSANFTKAWKKINEPIITGIGKFFFFTEAKEWEFFFFLKFYQQLIFCCLLPIIDKGFQ